MTEPDRDRRTDDRRAADPHEDNHILRREVPVQDEVRREQDHRDDQAQRIADHFPLTLQDEDEGEEKEADHTADDPFPDRPRGHDPPRDQEGERERRADRHRDDPRRIDQMETEKEGQAENEDPDTDKDIFVLFGEAATQDEVRDGDCEQKDDDGIMILELILLIQPPTTMPTTSCRMSS